MDEEAAAEPRWRDRIIYAASLAVQAAAFLAYLAGSPEEGTLFVAFLCWVGGRFASSLIHESGHALAALACRWRIVLFVVRPIGLQLVNRNLAMIPDGYNDGAGGWVAAVPRRAAADSKRVWAVIVAAGPAASFLLAGFAISAWAGSAPAYGHGADYGRLWIGLALQALYGGLFSLLPTSEAGASDGDQLRALAANQDYARGRPAAWIGTLLNANVRLRAIPDWMVVAAAEREGMAQWLAALEIGRTLDAVRPDAVRARSLIEDFRTRFGTDGWLAACDAWLAAIWEGDVDRARAALDVPQNAPGVPELTMAAEAAIAARIGEAELARILLEAMTDAVREKSPFRNPTFRDLRRQVEALLP